jgi:hypothetical protein
MIRLDWGAAACAIAHCQLKAAISKIGTSRNGRRSRILDVQMVRHSQLDPCLVWDETSVRIERVNRACQ